MNGDYFTLVCVLLGFILLAYKRARALSKRA